MRSNICKIENGTKDLAAILAESEKVAVYNELNAKQTAQLRLLCEELDGMLPEIVGSFEGRFWIDYEDGCCRINASIDLEDLDSERRDQLIQLSKNRKNAAASGIAGKIRAAVECFLLDMDAVGIYVPQPHGLEIPSSRDLEMYTQFWSLDTYKSTVRREDGSEAWDELERSVIASVADDVTVGVKGKQVDVVIVKKFA